MGQFIVSLLPGIYNFFVTLFLSDEASFVVLGDQVNGILGILNHLRFLRRHGHIGNGYGHGCACGIFVTCGFDCIQYFGSLGCAVSIDDFFKDLFQLFLTYQEINFQKKFIARYTSVYESKILRKDFVEQETSESGFYVAGQYGAIRHLLRAANQNSALERNYFVFVCKNGFVHALEELAFSLVARSLLGQIVDTKDHILRRNGYRTTIRRFQQVVR